MNLCLFLPLALTFFGCDSNDDTTKGSQDIQLNFSLSEINADQEEMTTGIHVSANREWSVYSNEEWISCTPTSSIHPEETVQVTVGENNSFDARKGSVVFRSGKKRGVIPVVQNGKPFNNEHSAYVPEGYSMVWNDEFESGTRPNTQKCGYETGNNGWGNN